MRDAAEPTAFVRFFQLSLDMLCVAGFEGPFKELNPAWQRTLGWTPRELMERPWMEFVHADDLAATEQAVQRLRQGQAIAAFENRYRCRDGSYRWLAWTAFPVPADQCIYGVARDVTNQRAAQQRLQEAADELSRILASISDAFFVLDENLVFTYFNPAAERLLNRRKDDVLGHALPEAFPEARGSVFEINYRQGIQDHQPHTFEAWFDVEPYRNWYEVRLYPHGRGICVYFQVTTARKVAEEALRQRAEELTALNALGREVSSTLSLEAITTAGLQGMLQAVRPDMAFLFLREGDRLLLKDVQPPSQRHRLGAIPEHRVGECMCGLAVRMKQPLFSRDIFHDLRCTWAECKQAGIKSFAALPLFGEGEVIGVVGLASQTVREFEPQAAFLETLASQISVALANARLFQTAQSELAERKRVEEALWHSTEKFRNLVEVSSDWIWEVDASGVYVYVSPKARELLGYEPQEMLGKTPFDFMPPAEAERVRQQFQQMAAGGKAVSSLENVNLHRSGREVVLETSAVPIFDAQGRLCGYRGIDRDITQRKQAEHERQQLFDREQAARAQAEMANRAKDLFLAAASHELRTPLAPVLMLASALERDHSLSEEVRQDLATIRQNVDIEKRLIADLLDFTALHTGKLSIRAVEASVHEAIRAAVDVCRGEMLRKKQHLTLDLQARRHLVRGDPDRLRQVFWNILQNASKFVPEEGSIWVRSADEAGMVKVEVQDSGRGISARALERIFLPFEQGPRQELQHYKGLGLGLAITRALVQAHGGSVIAASEGEGRGATFTVLLPALDIESMPALPQGGLQPVLGTPVARARPLRLLVVEDHVPTLRVLVRLLREQGHQVFEALTQAEARQIAAGEAIDVLISDLALPDGSGLDLLPALRQAHGVNVGIALSGYGAEGDLEASRKAGFIDHLVKPVSIEAIQASLSRLVQKVRS